jgi:glycosyltransferase involved in cell wall biosynthesis
LPAGAAALPAAIAAGGSTRDLRTLETIRTQGADGGEITLVAAQSPRYFPHVERHLNSLKKIFARVRLLYWEKDAAEPLYASPGVECERVILPFGIGGAFFFLRLMSSFYSKLRRMRPANIEAIDPYALIPARAAALRNSWPGRGSRARIAYFSMEYFPALPSLRGKPVKRRIWKALERWGASGAAAGAAVCDSIAGHLRADFGIPIVTVRNVPPRGRTEDAADRGPDGGDEAGRSALHARCGLPPGVPIVIYQGMLQEGRGLEISVRGVAAVPGLNFAIFGGGPLAGPLRALAASLGCADRIHLPGEVGFRDLLPLTRGALAGLAPIQALSASYRYSLPGKLFEYIQAGVPVVATDLPEIRKVLEAYGVGMCLEEYGPETLAAALRRLIGEPGLREGFLRNLPRAQAELCWEAEESRYLSLYR